jgi:uncharacterized protein with PIN domain
MIVVDTSAIVAIALGEPERQQFVGTIERAVLLLNDLLRLPNF